MIVYLSKISYNTLKWKYEKYSNQIGKTRKQAKKTK